MGVDRIIRHHKVYSGANVIARLGDYLKPMANNWLVVGDTRAGFAEDAAQSSTDAGLSVEMPVWARIASAK